MVSTAMVSFVERTANHAYGNSSIACFEFILVTRNGSMIRRRPTVWGPKCFAGTPGKSITSVTICHFLSAKAVGLFPPRVNPGSSPYPQQCAAFNLKLKPNVAKPTPMQDLLGIPWVPDSALYKYHTL